jgi:hypothetical protein
MEADRVSTWEREAVASGPAQAVLHVGFIVPELDAEMEEFRAALGIEWRVPVSADKKPSRFTLQHASYGFHVELLATATPCHADLLPNPTRGKDKR